MIYAPSVLLKLAQAYCAATGESQSTLGRRCAGNDKLFSRLADGRGCNLLTAQRASEWFAANWPEGIAWPEEAPIRPVSNEAA